MRPLRTILAVIIVGIGISAIGFATAQDGGTPDSVKSNQAFSTEKDGKITKALNWETGEGKSYFIPALEIPTILLLLNVYDRFAYPNEMENGKEVYNTNLATY